MTTNKTTNETINETTGDVFARYEDWCKATGECAVSRRKFCIEMKRIGVKHGKDNVTTYYGLRRKNKNTEISAA